jgi:hypothetical protein
MAEFNLQPSFVVYFYEKLQTVLGLPSEVTNGCVHLPG